MPGRIRVRLIARRDGALERLELGRAGLFNHLSERRAAQHAEIGLGAQRFQP